jgi:hypothetical protein
MWGKLLLFPLTGPIGGIIRIAEEIAKQVDREIMDKSRISKDLLELQVRLDLGKISEEEYKIRERELLEEWETITAIERENEEG